MCSKYEGYVWLFLYNQVFLPLTWKQVLYLTIFICISLIMTQIKYLVKRLRPFCFLLMWTASACPLPASLSGCQCPSHGAEELCMEHGRQPLSAGVCHCHCSGSSLIPVASHLPCHPVLFFYYGQSVFRVAY